MAFSHYRMFLMVLIVAIPANDTAINITDLSPDTYTIKVVDGTGCFTEINNIEMAGQLFMTPSITRILGCGATPDAEIQLNVQGGYALILMKLVKMVVLLLLLPPLHYSRCGKLSI